MKTQTYNLLTGNVTKGLVAFGMPVFFANLLQQFYGIVDMIAVGQFVGSAGLAAISNASMISFILTALCPGVAMGGTVLVAQYKGAGDAAALRESVGTLFSLTMICSIALTICGYLLYRPVFELMRVPGEAMQYACDYMHIICGGIIFVFGYNAVCAVLRGLGDSKNPLYFVMIATCVNVVLDIVLIGRYGMGTKGAAVATVISQAVSFVIAILYLWRKTTVFDFRWKSLVIKRNKAKLILRVGLPSAAQMAVVNLSYLIVTGMLNGFGVAVAAASGIGLKVNTFAAMPCWAVGQAVTTMAGQNMGAGDIPRVKKVVRAGLLISVLVSLVMIAMFQLFAQQVIMLFNTDAEVVREGVLYLRICCSLNCAAYAVMYTCNSFATGIGAAGFALVNSMIDCVVTRIVLSYLVGVTFGCGFLGIYVVEMAAPVLPAIAGFLYFKSRRWEKRSLIHAGQGGGNRARDNG